MKIKINFASCGELHIHELKNIFMNNKWMFSFEIHKNKNPILLEYDKFLIKDRIKHFLLNQKN